jgi:hypothetical protein
VGVGAKIALLGRRTAPPRKFYVKKSVEIFHIRNLECCQKVFDEIACRGAK